jgi:mRNA interferase MazF
MKKGEIYLVRFPFTDLSASKLRPALLLINFKQDISVCFITSQLNLMEESDILVAPDFNTGINQNSLIKVGKIATISKNLVFGRLGSLSGEQINILNQKL